MNYEELKKIIKEQKVPMSEAVQKKIQYLESDDVFTEPDSDYAFIFSALRQAENVSTPDDMYKNESNRATSFIEQAKNRMEGAAQYERRVAHINSNASMSDRIAALRGILNVSQEYAKYKK